VKINSAQKGHNFPNVTGISRLLHRLKHPTTSVAVLLVILATLLAPGAYAVETIEIRPRGADGTVDYSKPYFSQYGNVIREKNASGSNNGKSWAVQGLRCRLNGSQSRVERGQTTISLLCPVSKEV